VTTFNIHGVRLAVNAPDEQVLATIRRRLRHFEADCAGAPELRFDIGCMGAANDGEDCKDCELPRAPASARRVYDSAVGDVVYAEGADQLFFQVGSDLGVVVDARAGRMQALVRGPVAPHLWLLTHPVVTLPLLELLKRRGLYSVHAAGLALDGRGLLVAGTSGAGKSTLTVALLRAGFDFLGDDLVFLEPDAEPSRARAVLTPEPSGARSVPAPEGLGLRAFPDEIDLTEPSVRFFPELLPLLETPRQPGWPKWSVLAEDVYSAAISLRAVPRVLVFVRVGTSSRSILTPLAADEALIELAPNVLLTNPESSARHFAVLADLARSCRSYRLETGRDFDAIADLLRAELTRT
jgi:hypothetical protein